MTSIWIKNKALAHFMVQAANFSCTGLKKSLFLLARSLPKFSDILNLSLILFWACLLFAFDLWLRDPTFSYLTALLLSLQWNAGNNEFPVPPPEYNPLDEPSPLGLRLRKSPSLLDLIQMRLSQNNASSVAPTPAENSTAVSKKGTRGAATSGATDKLKASNFSGSLLRIGSWEVITMNLLSVVIWLSVNNLLLANFFYFVLVCI